LSPDTFPSTGFFSYFLNVTPPSVLYAIDCVNGFPLFIARCPPAEV
jgi:hypothetical protein